MRIIKWVAILALLLASISSGGCNSWERVDAEPPQEARPSGTALEADVADIFGSHLETSTVRYQESDTGSSWDVIVALASVPSDRSVDQYAAEVLAAVGSEDESSTPIYLTISAERFKPTWSEIEWGCFAYYWVDDLGAMDSRSDVVYLLHGEAERPGGPVHGCMLTSRERGEWGDVSLESLSEWAKTGAPVIWGLPERDG